MSGLDIALGIVLMIFAIAIIAVVLLQESRQAGLSGVIAGGADSFLSKNKARTADAILARITKFIAIAFFVLVIVTNVLLAVLG
ncbi:preprotein translocase subunit SecG [Solibaculum mannosilyticum]|uniref:Protein-export membrane protein SecG n=1 Tax=Solibaculum mannosilyticum TaxID=2780922 RepID=A0A7I8D511_9FIRM|nr:preprotein translocase subunit SecG [Solibaculum mannosilyticum]MCO7136369.1 preprotein translocase subunit SecG [[Clostridium] leptum]BCI60872.1 hypothetical protein C12CBH8_15110 [Solibaculum mannosilyticum]CZT55380.1 preprotein translocase subunit SecG [Eubacteriaceae bacterium CHKCI005]